MANGNGYFDSDGHVLEPEAEIAEYLEEPYKNYSGRRSFLPPFEMFHGPQAAVIKSHPGTFLPAPAQRWLDFLDQTKTEGTVLFPTAGLFFGRVTFPEWAVAYARAYNSWLYDKYVSVSPRLAAVALLPMQDVPAAVDELRRCVSELGMVGGMIPSNGLIRHIGAKEYWPIYQAAEELDCVLAVHGGNYEHLGFDTLASMPVARALGMPIPLLNGLAGLMIDGALDEFPTLRIGFMEGGTAWIPLLLDRMARELEYSGIPLKRKPIEYFQDDRLFVTCEGNERSLAYAIERVGPDPFMFASDFPHEISMDNAMEEIDEILERDDIREEHKMAILGDNARRFYYRK
jgi:predicted TIM-barrel fold metal-dependent hydrolase